MNSSFGPIESCTVRAFTIPTATEMESDGTLDWTSTTLVVVQIKCGSRRGTGYGYADGATARLIRDTLAPLIVGTSATSPAANFERMHRAVRNLGQSGIAAMAVSAVDVALWDLKARCLELPLFHLLGAVRNEIVAYGSGGFTNYSESQLKAQVLDWKQMDLSRFKIKIGRDANADRIRVRQVREWIGKDGEIFVDANGAHSVQEALEQAEHFKKWGVTWFEEPVPSSDLVGLRRIRDRAPAGMNITAGEYGYDVGYFNEMLKAGAVDVLQADATRCGGITGFLQAGVLCVANNIRLSAHTAPTLHAHLCCSVSAAIHVEYFFDHARIEKLLLEGAIVVAGGVLRPNADRSGLGIELKEKEAEAYEIDI